MKISCSANATVNIAILVQYNNLCSFKIITVVLCHSSNMRVLDHYVEPG